MATEDKLTEQSAIAAEGIKQLVEQGKKTLSVMEQLARVGPSSPAARAFAEAAWESRGAPRATAHQPATSIQETVQSGVSQIQAASQPQSRLRTPPSFASIQASIQHALAVGGDPVMAARYPHPTGGRGIFPPPLPVGSQWNPWPRTMPGLPVGSPGNPAPPGMPGLPTRDDELGGGISHRGGGFFGMPTPGRLAAVAGISLGIAERLGLGSLLPDPMTAEFSAGHGLEQWNAEAHAGAEFVRRRAAKAAAGDALANLGKGINKAVWGTNAPWVQGPTDGGERPSLGKALGDFFSVPWPSTTSMPDDVEHKHESGKTGVGDGVR